MTFSLALETLVLFITSRPVACDRRAQNRLEAIARSPFEQSSRLVAAIIVVQNKLYNARVRLNVAEGVDRCWWKSAFVNTELGLFFFTLVFLFELKFKIKLNEFFIVFATEGFRQTT